MKKSILRSGSVLIALLLLLSPGLSIQGAKKGLVLWYQTVVPALLPFMICSGLIVYTQAIPVIVKPFKPVLTHYFHLSDYGGYVFLSGLLCGYPIGAKTCSEFLDAGLIDTQEGQYLFTICNHPSPMFLLGYTALMLPEHIHYPLWLFSAYLPVLFIAWIKRGHRNDTENVLIQKTSSVCFDDILMANCMIMMKIGAYLMMFSIAGVYMQKIPFCPEALKAVFQGILEMTTGIDKVSELVRENQIPAIYGAAAMLFFVETGGISGLFQVKSVTKNAGLSIRHYITWKLLYASLSCILFILLSVIQAAVVPHL